VKFTNPEARYLVQSSREWMRRARRHERTVKVNIHEPRAMFFAQCVDTCRREAAQRMKLAKELEIAK
jgi:hypothetical protein